MKSAGEHFKGYASKEALHRFIFEILGRNIFDVRKDFRGIRMKKGRKTIHHLRPKITMAVPGELVNATGLEGTPEYVNIDSTGLEQTPKKGDNEGESGANTRCLEGPPEDKDTAGVEGPPGAVDTTGTEGPPGDVKITGMAGISDEVNTMGVEGIPDDVDTTCTKGPQGDVDTPAVEGATDDVDTTGLEKTPRKKDVDMTGLEKNTNK